MQGDDGNFPVHGSPGALSLPPPAPQQRPDIWSVLSPASTCAGQAGRGAATTRPAGRASTACRCSPSHQPSCRPSAPSPCAAPRGEAVPPARSAARRTCPAEGGQRRQPAGLPRLNPGPSARSSAEPQPRRPRLGPGSGAQSERLGEQTQGGRDGKIKWSRTGPYHARSCTAGWILETS